MTQHPEKRVDTFDFFGESSDQAPDYEFTITPAHQQQQSFKKCLVFVIPGMFSDPTWTANLKIYSTDWNAAKLDIKTVGPTSGIDLNIWHLVFGMGLNSFKRQMINQITDIATRHKNVPINFIAHSLGSALFGEIIEELRKHESIGSRIDSVIFLGSVCHRKHSRSLHNSADRCINHVGTKDIWPYIASIIKFYRFGDVGRFGFRNSWVDDYFFDYKHSDGTKIEHFQQYVFPIFGGDHIRYPIPRKDHLGIHTVLRILRGGIFTAAIGAITYLLLRYIVGI